MAGAPVLGRLEKSIVSIIHSLVEHGLADRFTMPSLSANNAHTGDIGFKSDVDVSWAMKDQPYAQLYHELVEREQFHVLLPDGGILQFQYQVRLGKISKHRLAYYPCNSLRPFDAEVLRYLEDSVWGHVVTEFQVPVVVRLDYDSSPASFVPGTHSASHMTLGQYPNCRIPVSAPFTPWGFVEFILRNFYSRAYVPVSKSITSADFSFDRCLTKEEEVHTYINLPQLSVR